MGQQTPLLISFHHSRSNFDSVLEAKNNSHFIKAIPHYFTERDHPWMRLYLDQFIRFKDHPRREIIEYFESPLPFQSPEKKRKFLLSVLDQLSKADPSPKIGLRAKQLRNELFTVAATHSNKPSAHTVLPIISEKIKLTEENLLQLIFADLPLERKLSKIPENMSPQELGLRANLSLAQKIMHQSIQIKIQAIGNIRRIIRQAKLRKLLCQITSLPVKEHFTLEISGPLSLFGPTKLYSRAMAELIPLLFWCNRFSLSAQCRIKGRSCIFELNSNDPLLPSNEPLHYDSKVEAQFARDFSKNFKEWDLIREPEPFVLPNTQGRMIFPDFKLQHRRILEHFWYLEIVGFWTPHYLQQKLYNIDAAHIPKLILCVDSKLACVANPLIDQYSMNHILFFKNKIQVNDLKKFLFN